MSCGRHARWSPEATKGWLAGPEFAGRSWKRLPSGQGSRLLAVVHLLGRVISKKKPRPGRAPGRRTDRVCGCTLLADSESGQGLNRCHDRRRSARANRGQAADAGGVGRPPARSFLGQFARVSREFPLTHPSRPLCQPCTRFGRHKSRQNFPFLEEQRPAHRPTIVSARKPRARPGARRKLPPDPEAEARVRDFFARMTRPP